MEVEEGSVESCTTSHNVEKYREKKYRKNSNKVVSVTWSNGNPPQGPVRRIRSTGPAGEVIFPFITSRECDY